MFDRLLDFLLSSLKLFRLYVIVPPWERGVVLRFGKFNRLSKPGLVWTIPLGVDHVYASPAYVQTMKIGPQSLVTRDEKEVVVSTLITYVVKDHVKHLIVIDGGTQAIEDTAYGVVADFVRSVDWSAIAHDGDVAKDLSIQMSKRASLYGVRIRGTQIIDLTKSISVRLIQHSAAKGPALDLA